MVNRAFVIALLVVIAAVSSAATRLIVNYKEFCKPALREKFFGSNTELPPIKEGQEMRPRW